jgi:hypothetical protein
MSESPDSLLATVELLQRRAPEYVDLISARTDAEFEDAFDAILERAIHQLEAGKTLFASLDENGLTAALALGLSMPGLSVTRETSSNGHVDITITADHCMPMRKKLGEAKIYDGPEYHVKGLTQLLGRYTTGREGRGLLIVYFQKRDIVGLVARLRERMDKDRPLDQREPTADHAIRWWFRSRHGHSCGEDLDITHVGCNLFVEPAGAVES